MDFYQLPEARPIKDGLCAGEWGIFLYCYCPVKDIYVMLDVDPTSAVEPEDATERHYRLPRSFMRQAFKSLGSGEEEMAFKAVAEGYEEEGQPEVMALLKRLQRHKES